MPLELIKLDQNVLDVKWPQSVTSRLIVSCPHAGMFVPNEAFGSFSASISDVLMRGDRHTDILTDSAVLFGVPQVISRIAPSFLNVGRPTTSLAPDDVRGGLSDLPYKIDKYVEGGKGQGLVAVKTLYGEQDIYKAGLRPDEKEIKRRIERFYDPFHNSLEAVVGKIMMQMNRAVVFDIHSCPSEGTDKDIDTGYARPDLIFSDADGRSCDHTIINTCVALSREWGYSVNVNHPYKGGFVTQKYGAHGSYGRFRGTQAFQVEFSRSAMGLNESTTDIVDVAKFVRLRDFSGTLIRAISRQIQ